MAVLSTLRRHISVLDKEILLLALYNRWRKPRAKRKHRWWVRPINHIGGRHKAPTTISLESFSRTRISSTGISVQQGNSLPKFSTTLSRIWLKSTTQVVSTCHNQGNYKEMIEIPSRAGSGRGENRYMTDSKKRVRARPPAPHPHPRRGNSWREIHWIDFFTRARTRLRARTRAVEKQLYSKQVITLQDKMHIFPKRNKH